MPLHLLSPRGFRAGGVACGIKVSGKPDVGLLVADRCVPAAAMFTTNKVLAAPIVVGREHVSRGEVRAIVVNSGNANACTGARGLKDARAMCALAGKLIGVDAREVLPSSTGVIGHLMPMDKVEAGIRAAISNLGDSQEHAIAFRNAIMTTDAFPKEAATTVRIGKSVVMLAGICKGAGMIGPRMALPGSMKSGRSNSLRKLHATMLAYVTTDADISSNLLSKLLASAVAKSLNVCAVDDHMSTNDTIALMASGASGVKIDSVQSKKKFLDALTDLSISLAKQIVSDGEGATKVVIVRVTGATSDLAAERIARTIANSNLVKCALHGNDPNWGRIVSAAGMAQVDFNPDRATLKLQGATVFKAGSPVPIDESTVSQSMNAKEVDIHLDCKLGKGQTILYTCDLSREYIRINADYTT